MSFFWKVCKIWRVSRCHYIGSFFWVYCCRFFGSLFADFLISYQSLMFRHVFRALSLKAMLWIRSVFWTRSGYLEYTGSAPDLETWARLKKLESLVPLKVNITWERVFLHISYFFFFISFQRSPFLSHIFYVWIRFGSVTDFEYDWEIGNSGSYKYSWRVNLYP